MLSKLGTINVADPDHFDTGSDLDPAFHFDTDPDQTFHFSVYLIHGSGYLLFQRGNVPKGVLFTHFNFISLSEGPAGAKQQASGVKFSLSFK
jgi:hypothetical protein